MTKKVKFTMEEVKTFFESRGYELLSDTYEGANYKLKYKCHKHPDKELFITLSCLKNGNNGCVYCSGLNKPTLDEVRANFAKLGLTLLASTYNNQREKMPYICEKHPEEIQHSIYKTIKKGHGCKLCGRKTAASKTTGENNWNWQGGISEIRNHLRKQIGDWKFESLKANEFLCDITKEKASDLQVHHLTPFHIIRDKILSELGLTVKENIGDYSKEELSQLTTAIRIQHKKELGVPLRYHIHRKFHAEYGNNTTPSQYYEFKERYLRGEFDAKIT